MEIKFKIVGDVKLYIKILPEPFHFEFLTCSVIPSPRWILHCDLPKNWETLLEFAASCEQGTPRGKLDQVMDKPLRKE